jgi:hypothetical protein
MDTRISADVLRRYTDLPSLLHLLGGKRLTLLDPRTWDDTNDSYYLLKYKEKKSLKTLLALCLTQAEETYHHWRVFSQGSSGVCIHFNRRVFVDTLLRHRGMTVRAVEYRRVRDVRRRPVAPAIADLPFLKRAGFSAESEVRVIFESATKALPYLDVPIALTSIDKITLSPWLNKRLSATVKEVVSAMPGCAGINVRRSTLVGNTLWKKLGDEAA